MSDTKRALVEIIRVNPNAAAGDLVDAILARIREADDEVVDAMEREMVRVGLTPGQASKGARKALAAAMRAIGTQGRPADPDGTRS